jgi:hypothetical protein
MAFGPLRSYVDAFDDDDGDIADWMARRNAQLAGRDAAEAAGREAWNQATRTGQDIVAATPHDLIRLGGQTLADSGPDPEAQADPPSSVDPVQPIKPDGPLATPPDLRFATAQPGDSISRLVGTSDPAAVGRFLSLNGMDPRNSTIFAGRSYAVPTQYDNATDDEVNAGAHVLRSDNARLAAPQAQRAAAQAADDVWQQRFSSGRNVWTGEPTGQLRVAAPTPPAAPQQQTSQSWLDRSTFAKQTLGDAAGLAGQGYGVVRGGVHTVQGAIDGAAFLAELPFSSSAQNQVRELGHKVADYARTRAADPGLVGRDLRTFAHSENVKLNPYATPMADTLSGELQRRFGIGANQGETAFDVGSVLFGGEVAKGLEAAAVAREAPAVEAYVRAHLPADEAEYMLGRDVGRGSHWIPLRTKLPWGGKIPPQLMNSRFNVSKLEGANRWQQQKYHFENDTNFYGNGFPWRTGKGSGWNGERDYGWQRNDPLTRLIVGMPADTKGLVGGAAAAGLDTGYDALEQEQPQ